MRFPLLLFVAALFLGSLHAEKISPALAGTYRKVSATGNVPVLSVRIQLSGEIFVQAVVWNQGPDDAVGRGITLRGTVGPVRMVHRAGKTELITRLEANSPQKNLPFSVIVRVEERLVQKKVPRFSGRLFYSDKKVGTFVVKRSGK